MTGEIKVLCIIQATTKDGRAYQIAHCLITLGDKQFVRKFYLFA